MFRLFSTFSSLKPVNLSSYFFVLPQKASVFEKLKNWDKPDCYLLDLQDGCPQPLKETARDNIRKNIDLLETLDVKVMLRVNGYNSKSELEKDMELLYLDGVNGVMLPMIESVENVENMNLWLEQIEDNHGKPRNSLELIPLIETAISTLKIDKISVAAPRISAIALGLFDLFADTNASMNKENINFISNLVMLGAKGANLPFIDSPFTDIHDYSSFYADCQKSIDIGANGKLILHPDHIDVVNRCFSINEAKKKQLADKLIGYSGGCSINGAGDFIGPPVEKQIRHELTKKVRTKTPSKNGIRPKKFKYGLDINTVYEGQTIACPYEITVDDSWTTMWSSLVAMGNSLETSDAFCQKVGLPSKVMPFSAMLNLTLCMAVEKFSESCLLHLGLEDVVYEKPAHSGDTFRCYVYVEGLRNTSDGKRSVISSRHILLNQHNERIFSFKRKTLFPHIKELSNKIGNALINPSELQKQLAADHNSTLRNYIDCCSFSKHASIGHSVASQDLLIHDASRHIGESENLLFTTLFRNTHPVHFNYLRHEKNEIIVCGGFVMAVTLANALKDLKQVVDQQIISCSHINKIAPMDTISSATYIHDRKMEGDHLEVLTLKTIGIRNVDAANDLYTSDWPLDLFSKNDLRPADMEKLLRKEMPELFHKVCIQILWKVWRPVTEYSLTRKQ